MDLVAGTRLGPYEIQHFVGAGGMGKVYYALDTKLGRYVALKVLLPELTTNEERLRRFELEGRSASALNHPNILTIFDIGQEGNTYFIVSEFVDGVTLRQLMRQECPTLGRLLDIATQIAAALAAAHACGIVHRDIKPENIMLRPDGYVKVLDFGLAKLTPTNDQRDVDRDAPTALNINTDAGTVMGTVDYMAPEQIRAMKVDGRADIWSLGVVLYEMITSHPPFSGSTKSDIIAAILREEPKPLATYSADLPPELQHIVSKTLRKEREERYQMVRDLLIDLKNLKQDLISSSSMSGQHAHKSQAKSAPTVQQDGETTDKVEPAKSTSGVEYFIDEFKRHRVGWTIVLAVAVLVIVMGLVTWSRRTPSSVTNSPSPFTPLGVLRSTEIMATSNVREGAISPDGRYVAMVIEDAGKQSIKIQRPNNASESLVIADGGEYRGLVFSRDGYSVYYLGKDEKGSALYQVPTVGGAARKLVSDLNTPIAVSPDGNQLAFVRSKGGRTVLMTSRADGTGERELANPPDQSEFGTFLINNGPVWSPDGQVIACPTRGLGDPMRMEVVAISVVDGALKRIGSRQWFLVGQLAWLSDGSGLIMDAQEKMPPETTPQLWYLSYPEGEARTLTSDVGYYHGVSLTTDSATLLTTKTSQTSTVWIVSGPRLEHSEELPSSRYKGSGGLAWTPDGNIVYSSNETGTMEIWSTDGQGGNAKQITFNKQTCVQPTVSRGDSSYIVFACYPEGQPHIMRLDKSSNELKQLTSGSYEDWPDLSPDGKWVVYHGTDSSVDRIWKIPIDGGSPTPLSDRAARHPVFSPDGRQIACFLENEGSSWQLAVVPVGGGLPLKTFSMPESVARQWGGPRWNADGSAITYIVTKGGVSNVWMQSLTAGPANQLTNFREDQIFAFAWSLDGKRLALVRGVNAKSVVLVNLRRRE